MIELLEENTGVNLYELWLGNGSLDVTTKAQGVIRKIDKLYFIEIKNFGPTKGNISVQKGKRPTKWEKIFSNHVGDKRLVSIKYKEPLQCSNRRRPQNMAKDLDKHFSKENI